MAYISPTYCPISWQHLCFKIYVPIDNPHHPRFMHVHPKPTLSLKSILHTHTTFEGFKCMTITHIIGFRLCVGYSGEVGLMCRLNWCIYIFHKGLSWKYSILQINNDISKLHCYKYIHKQNGFFQIQAQVHNLKYLKLDLHLMCFWHSLSSWQTQGLHQI